MSVIDFPAFDRDVPRLGTFVAVALDPVASLAVLDDQTVETAANRVTTRKRLVMVDFVLGGHGGAYYRYHPIGSGLPGDPLECVPIEPAIAHPEDRPPVSCSEPLPVDDPYVHTAEAFEGGVSRIYMGQPSNIQCSTEDRRRVSRQYLRYLMRRSMSVPLHPVYEPQPQDSTAPQDGSASQPGSAGDGAPVEETQYFMVENPWADCPPTFLQPKYQMWLHVDENESYANPSTLQDEMAQLYAIEKEWRERREAEVKAKLDQLQAWREGVDVPHGTEEQERCNPGDLAHDDATILPEHAVGEDFVGEEKAAPSESIDVVGPASAVTDDMPQPKSTLPCDEPQPQRAVPQKRTECTLLATATDSTSTIASAKGTASSGSALSNWVMPARAWVAGVAFSKARFFRALSALLAGEHW